MSSNLTIPTLPIARGPIADKNGMPTWEFKKQMQEWALQLANLATAVGEIKSNTRIEGRTEGIGTTVENIDSVGDFDADAVIDGATKGITTFSQRTGGGLARTALDDNARLESSLRLNPVDVTAVPLDSAALSNDGVTPLITVDANSFQVGGVSLSYNAGAVDPGVFGTFWVFFDDPTFAGGAVTYQFSDTPFIQAANKGRFMVGKITTTLATPHTGGGNTGGDTPDGGGGRGYFLA